MRTDPTAAAINPTNPAADALLRRLRYFVAVGEELHFGRAAQRLNMAQPPLSQQIRRLEQELGYALFLRGHAGPSRVALTAAGSTLLETARRIAASAAAGLDDAGRYARGERGTLRLAFAASVMLTPAAGLVRAFRDRQPDVRMTLSEMVTTVQLEALRAGEIDAGLMREAPAAADLDVLPLLRESFAIALPRRHPLASRARLPLRALAREPFVLVPRDAGPAFYDRIIALCSAAGFEPDIVQVAVQWQTVVGLVATGLGVSLVTEGVRSLRIPGVVYRPLPRTSATTSIQLVTRAGEDTPILASLRALVRERPGFADGAAWSRG